MHLTWLRPTSKDLFLKQQITSDFLQPVYLAGVLLLQAITVFSKLAPLKD